MGVRLSVASDSEMREVRIWRSEVSDSSFRGDKASALARTARIG
jgi:hypothetical protein